MDGPGAGRRRYVSGGTELICCRFAASFDGGFFNRLYKFRFTLRTMKPFTVHRGRLAPLDRVNVDTDQIIPKQFLKRIEETGFGQFVFYDWRFGVDGTKNPDFVLHEPRYQGASILIAGKNFGCGSSREHAVWALADYGFRVVISSSFAESSPTTALRTDSSPCSSERRGRTLMQRAQEIDDYQVTIDLEKCEVHDDRGFRANFRSTNSSVTAC